MVQEVEVGLKISETIIFTTTEKVLMVMGEVDLGHISVPLPTIIQV